MIPLAFFSMLSGSIYSAELFNEGFEGETTDWTGRSAETLVLTKEKAHSGSQSLFVSGRTDIWNGATVSKSLIEPGGSYQFEGYVLYDNSASSQGFDLCIQYTVDGETKYKNVGSVTAYSNQWALMKGSIDIPDEATGIALYVQTSYTSNPKEQDLMDFYIDDIVCSNSEIFVDTSVPALKDLFRDYFKIGTAATASEISSKPIQKLALHHFNSVTPGNELKPDALLNQELSKSQGNNVNPQVTLPYETKVVLKWCNDHNIPIRGHVCVWHSQTPDWFFNENFESYGNVVSEEIMNQRMENYIKNVMELVTTTYPDLKIYAWDIVNEAFVDNGSLRNPGSNYSQPESSMWMKVYGSNKFIYNAFTYARKYAPEECKLYYNDYNEYIDAKRDAIYSIVKDLYEKNLCDGIGMQSHLDTGYPFVWQYTEALKKYASIGCDIQITELDITCTDESAQAKMYKELFEVYKEYKDKISAVIFWGTQDGISWRKEGKPLIYNDQYEPKKAYYEIIDGMELPTSVEETSVDGITIAPNVFDDELNIQIEGPFIYRVIDSKGVLMVEGCANGEATLLTHQWSAGLYVVMIESEQGNSSQKVVKK